MFESESAKWAMKTFGEADLKDKRRTARLVTLATDLADKPGVSLPQACADAASMEGAYRFIENDDIDPSAIAQAGFLQTAAECSKRKTVLALEDTTGLGFRHSVCQELGDQSFGNNASSTGRSLYGHSILALDADTECVIGLAHQQCFIRNGLPPELKNNSAARVNRPREQKDSYRWEAASKQMDETFTRTDNVLHVCDREADSYEYMEQHLSNGRRFLVRCQHNRSLQLSDQDKSVKLDALAELPVMATKEIHITQRGKTRKAAARPKRTTKMGVSYQQVTLKRPQRSDNNVDKTITLNLVVCRELEPLDEASKLCWFLYTNESIQSVEDALKLVRYYELRWRIEDFHKTWKTDGTNIEGLRMQTRGNMERIAVILAFVAVRLMQLKDVAQNNEAAKEASCEQMFSTQEWKMLWLQTQKGKVPSSPPSLYWAYYALAKLGGWYDSKRTGRVGVKALWKGWGKLMLMIEGYRTMSALNNNTN